MGFYSIIMIERYCVLIYYTDFMLSCLLAAWMYIGMIGGFLFLLLQLILLVDFAYKWNESWLVLRSSQILAETLSLVKCQTVQCVLKYSITNFIHVYKFYFLQSSLKTIFLYFTLKSLEWTHEQFSSSILTYSTVEPTMTHKPIFCINNLRRLTLVYMYKDLVRVVGFIHNIVY